MSTPIQFLRFSHEFSQIILLQSSNIPV